MADFFTPDTSYLRNDPYKAPEQLEVFHCVAVAKNPRNGELRAFGFAKGLTDPVEGWYSTALTPEVWAVGWVEHAEVLFASDAETADAATEAFVDVADAERYALRDEYVNAERTTLAEQLRKAGAEQAAQDAEADAFHAQRRADEAEANGEYVDYDEAEAVREIEREMAIEAGDDSELDRQVAEDEARFERAVWVAARDAEAADDAMSASERFEHDQADEARLDARDAEGGPF